MSKQKNKRALDYHSGGRPGKIEVMPTKPYATQDDLSLAYSPGVAAPSMEIEHDPQAVYEYTDKGNLVAIVSNGTAVLGLGDVGPLASKPVMEGKSLLFKVYAGIDAFDIEVNERDTERFIAEVVAMAPTFGGINLEDIKAPECFEIEDRLRRELDIPVMHDDQHGTAIVSGAALLNALELAHKRIEEVSVVINGAGAAAISCARMYVLLGVPRGNIVMLDSRGVIHSNRTEFDGGKADFATDQHHLTTLEEAVHGADVFVGLSRGGLLSVDMLMSMAQHPIVFALANPEPEISYSDALGARDDVLFATGRSDYPNQVNNVLGFPYIFRGALDTRATQINEEMKLAAVRAIAQLAKAPVPEVVSRVYGGVDLRFGPNYFIPKPNDPRLLLHVSMTVAKAAMSSGVARREISDWSAYYADLVSKLPAKA